MANSSFLEREIAPLRRLLDDACKGIAAAEAALAHHSRPDARLMAVNFPLEESILREAVGLWGDWKARAADLLRKLDRETAGVNLQFERLFDEMAGRQSQNFLQRRVHLGNPAPEAIALHLVSLLSVSAALDRMLAEVRPFLALHHRSCEACLLQLTDRRRQMDVDLEDAERQLASLKARTHERLSSPVAPRSAVLDPGSEAERRELALDRKAAQTREEMLRSERETLMRVISDDEDFLDVLNAGIGAVNVMAGKLAVDIEQRVALLKAAWAQSAVPAEDLPDGVEDLIADFDANALAGHDLLIRKQRAEDAFSRKLEAAPTNPAATADEAEEIPLVPSEQAASI